MSDISSSTWTQHSCWLKMKQKKEEKSTETDIALLDRHQKLILEPNLSNRQATTFRSQNEIQAHIDLLFLLMLRKDKHWSVQRSKEEVRQNKTIWDIDARRQCRQAYTHLLQKSLFIIYSKWFFTYPLWRKDQRGYLQIPNIGLIKALKIIQPQLQMSRKKLQK